MNITNSLNVVKNRKVLHQLCRYSFLFPGFKKSQRALDDAEKLVGYPTSAGSLKWIVDEEPANFFAYAKKLAGSNHPLLHIGRDLLTKDVNVYLGGLWVLLVSKAAGRSDQVFKEDLVDGIHKKQRSLAEITELINTAFLIHNSIVDVERDNQFVQSSNRKTLEFGNKLSILGGDYLQSKASVELAKLGNLKVVNLIAQSLCHCAEGYALEHSFGRNVTRSEWDQYVFLKKGSLLANSCKSSMILGGHDSQHEEAAYNFGKHLAVAKQCSDDIKTFKNTSEPLKPWNLIMVLANDSSIDGTRDEILEQYPNVVDQVNEIAERYVGLSTQSLRPFKQKETLKAIDDLIKTLTY